jgi:hypothetical protein
MIAVTHQYVWQLWLVKYGNWLVVRSLHCHPFGAFSHKNFSGFIACATLCDGVSIFGAFYPKNVSRIYLMCDSPFYLMLKQGKVRTRNEGAGVQQEAPGPATRRRSGTAARAQETTREKGQKMHETLLISSKKAFFRPVMYSDILQGCPKVYSVYR